MSAVEELLGRHGLTGGDLRAAKKNVRGIDVMMLVTGESRKVWEAVASCLDTAFAPGDPRSDEVERRSAVLDCRAIVAEVLR